MATGYYRNRNPGWISGGIEKDGAIHWSQPEVLLYDDDPTVRMSYPDFIESDGRYFITETQKTVAQSTKSIVPCWRDFGSNSKKDKSLAAAWP